MTDDWLHSLARVGAIRPTLSVTTLRHLCQLTHAAADSTLAACASELALSLGPLSFIERKGPVVVDCGGGVAAAERKSLAGHRHERRPDVHFSTSARNPARTTSVSVRPRLVAICSSRSTSS